MALLEFQIPLCREDLLRQGDRSHYFVSDCCTCGELTAKIDDCRRVLVRTGPAAIAECFDVFYSLLREFSDVSAAVREEYWIIALRTLEDHCRALGEAELAPLSSEEKRRMRNTLKMLVYVVVQLVEDFESESTTRDLAIGATRSRKGGKKKSVGVASGLDWAGQREGVVELLSQLTELELVQLWEPPTPQMMEDCSNLIAACCYKLLENPAVAREKALRDKVFHLMGTLIKSYSQALSISLKVIQLLQHFEHLVSPLAVAVAMWVEQFGAKSIVAEVVRELGSKDPKDLALDASGTRCFSAFLVELAQRVPGAVLPTISVLLPHLSGEAYTMRNGVLGVIGEVVCQVLSSPEIDQQARTTRDRLLDKLEEHLYDVIAFVRSKTLQIWLQLCNAKAIPLTRQRPLLQLVVGRLRDKSCTVRKHAVQLLAAFLTGNPFAGKLDEEEFQSKLAAEEAKLRSLLPPESAEGEGEGQVAEREEEGGAADTQAPGQAEEVAKQMAVVQYLRDGLSFIRTMADCIPVATQLLGSRSASDVLEALELLATAFEFGVQGAREGVRKGLVLVWSREQQVRDAVVATYVRLYLRPEVENPRLLTAAIVKSLLRLPQGASYGDLASLDEMVSLLIQGKHISPAVVRMLWDTFTRRVPGTAIEEARSAALILSMAGGADREIVRSNIDILVAHGLGGSDTDTDTGSGTCPDLLLAKYTCMALQRLAASKTKRGQVADKPFRLLPSHQMFQRISSILINEVANTEVSYWSSFAEQAIATVYKLADQPDELCSSLLKSLTAKVFSSAVAAACSSATEEAEEEGGGAGGVPPSSSVDSLPEDFDPMACSSQDPASVGGEAPPTASSQQLILNPVLLSRLLFCAGHVAQWTLVHVEVSVLREIKRRRSLQEKEGSQQNSKGGSAAAAPQPTPGGLSSRKTPGKKGPTEPPSIEDEMGLAGAAADDVEADVVRKVCEYEVGGVGLLSWFESIIVAVVTNPSKYPCPTLQASASLALAKFMLISSTLCDRYLQLLFTIMEKSPQPSIRANMIIAAGDLTFRFPNLIEPWTPHLYARLRDDSPTVRKNTLVVLTHLILNDMVKVKGQISELALCLEDQEQQIADHARLFFHELSKKGNALYNVIPDIISHLSDPQHPAPLEGFGRIMKYLLTFIQKDRQCESLVEKLCHRFRAARTERQWHDLAHCLSQLSFTERCVRKLQENLPCYLDKMADPEVFAAFTSIINKSKKFAKPDVKAMVEELERKLQEANRKGLEEAENAATVSQQGEGEEEGGEGQQPAAGDEGQEEGPLGDRGEKEKESGGELDKENEPAEFLPPVTPANRKSRKKPATAAKSKTAKSTAKKKGHHERSSRKPLTETRNVLAEAGRDVSDDDFERDVLSSARKALVNSARKSTIKTAKKRVRKAVVFSSEDEDGEIEVVPKSSSKRPVQRLLLSDDDD